MELKVNNDAVDELLAAISQGSLREICKQKGKRTPDFLIGATNVYRTSEFIVKQEIKTICDSDKNTYMISKDTYYLRNEDLDDYYECYFAKRKELNGKRFSVTMYVRAYVD